MRTLIPFLQQLKDQQVELELKDGSVVVGKVDFIDHAMNTHLSGEVKISTKGQNTRKFEKFCVRGGTIRYFKLPQTLNIDALLLKAEKSHKTAGIGGGQKDVPKRKQARAEGTAADS